MRRIAPLTSLALLLVASSPAGAAEWFAGSQAPLSGADSDLPAAIEGHLRSREAELRLDGVQLRPARQARTVR